MSMGWRATLVLSTLLLSSCGIGDDEDKDDGDLTVTVVRGIELAPPKLQRATGPAARYLQNSDLIVFVSTPLYSGSCPPEAEAEEDSSTVTLTIDPVDANCTADANRYTFLIQGFAGSHRDLVVSQDSEEWHLRISE